MIVQHEGKLTIKQIEEISKESDVLSNFYHSDRFPTLRDWWVSRFLSPRIESLREIELTRRMHGGEIAKFFGEPNCHMRGYESYPGAWIFYDTESNVRWLVFSDGIRKSCFKGTSYEVSIPDNFTEDQFRKAINKFFLHFGCIPLDKNKHGL